MLSDENKNGRRNAAIFILEIFCILHPLGQLSLPGHLPTQDLEEGNWHVEKIKPLPVLFQREIFSCEGILCYNQHASG